LENLELKEKNDIEIPPVLELEGEGLRILCYETMALGVYHFDLIL